MKKVLALMLALVLVLPLAACGGSGIEDSNKDPVEDSNINPIIGKWKLSSSDSTLLKSHNNKSEYPVTIKNNGDLEFFEDGSCNAPIYTCYILDGTDFIISELDYSSYYTRANGKIYFSRNGNDYNDYEYSIINDQLVITIEEHPADSWETRIKTFTYERAD